MKKLFVIPFLLYSSVVFSDVEAVVNDIGKILSAERVCNYEVNDVMVNLYIDLNISDRSDLQPGGRHYKSFEKVLRGIISHTSTPETSNSFCKKVLEDLPAYFKYEGSEY
jgi:hypothetical protein